ncbi:MAG: ABC-2 transporter permease [Oscillospiraceae bacterium]|nr:ABC-2 transporter permease [Oscillospiraceae bacterium]
MSEILNLIKLEFICTRKKVLVPMLASIIVYALLGFFMMPEIMVSFIIFSGLFPYAMFNIAAKNNFNNLYGMLPIKRSSIVSARFISGALSIGFVTALVIPISYAAQLAGRYDKDLTGFLGLSVLNMGTVYFVIICIFTSIQYSLTFIFGTEREVIVTILSAVIFILLIILMPFTFTDMIDWMIVKIGDISYSTPPLFYVIAYAFGLAVMGLSAVITALIMRKREL